MKIIVASALKAGSQVANAINTVKMAEGFARLGHDVRVLCCRDWRRAASCRRLEEIYGISTTIGWTQLPISIGAHWGYALPANFHVRKFKPDVIYARNYILPAITARDGIPTIVESHAHEGNRSPQFMRLVQATQRPCFLRLVTISRHLADYYAALGVPQNKLMVLPDAVDLRLFKRPRQLTWSPYAGNGPHIVYAGHLYDYKGVPTVLAAAAGMPDATFHLVGGVKEDIERQQRLGRQLGAHNVRFHGMMPHAQLPQYLWNADVLLLPPSGKHPSAKWTSPVKLGEYLASGTPVVATDIPALRDWLMDDVVEFVCPDDACALASGIRRVLADKSRATQLAENAVGMAEGLTYERRAEKILEGVIRS